MCDFCELDELGFPKKMDFPIDLGVLGDGVVHFCLDEKNIYFSLSYADRHTYIWGVRIPAKYCPMCGEELNVWNDSIKPSSFVMEETNKTP